MNGARRRSRSSKRPRRSAGRTRQEEQLIENILKCRELGLKLPPLEGRPYEPLAVYGYYPFPILFMDYLQSKKERTPRWDQLSSWMKIQIIIMAFSEWNSNFLTFDVHLHKQKTKELIAHGTDIREFIRDRSRKELDTAVGKRSAFFFIVEGTSKKTRQPCGVHIHGGVWLSDPGDKAKAIRAIERACSQGTRGYAKEPRAMHSKLFHGGGACWGNYITKFVHIKDERLAERRLTMSQEAIGAGREFWNLITGRYGPETKLRALMIEQGLLEIEE